MIEDAPFACLMTGQVSRLTDLPIPARYGRIPPFYYRPCSRTCRLPFTQARRDHKTMALAAAEDITSLVAFTLPGTPYSVRMARFYIRAALTCHGLDDYAEDAEMVASDSLNLANCSACPF
jgi:hypothetical protein